MTWFNWISPVISAAADHLELIASFVAAPLVILGILAFKRLIGDFNRV